MGSHARLRNGPVHQPHASSNSEPNRCSSSAFFTFLSRIYRTIPFLCILHSCCLHLSFLLPSSFILSTCPSMPPTAVKCHSLFLSFHRHSLVHAHLHCPATQLPLPPSFSHHVLLPTHHAIFHFHFRLCPHPHPTIHFHAAVPPMLLTPHQCLSPATHTHNICTPQLPLCHQ